MTRSLPSFSRNGLKLGRSTLTGFVLLPMVVIIILKAGMSSLDVQEVDSALSKLDDVSSLLIMLGVPMAALAFFKGFYPKGSFSRFLPSVIMVLISLYWIWTVGLGGKFVFDAIEDVSIDLDFSKLLLLLMVGTGLWIVYYALELLLYRPEWKKGGFPKDLLEERKARKEAQRKAKEERKAAKEKAKEDKKAAKEKKKADAETPTQDGKEP